MVEIIEADPLGIRVALAEPVELGLVGRSLGTIGLDEIEQRAADADNRRDIEHLVVPFIGNCAFRHRVIEGVLGVDDAPGHRRGAGTMICDETRGMTAGFGVEDIVDVTLSPDGDVFVLCLATAT